MSSGAGRKLLAGELLAHHGVLITPSSRWITDSAGQSWTLRRNRQRRF